MLGKEKRFLLDLLLEKGLINQDQLIAVLSLQRKKGGRIIDHLIDVDSLSEKTLISFFIKECGYHYVNLNHVEVDPDALKEISQQLAEKLTVIPVRKARDILAVVVRDPLDQEVVAELEKATVYQILPLAGRKEDILKALFKYYHASLQDEIAL